MAQAGIRSGWNLLRNEKETNPFHLLQFAQPA
jgi:hypothetical protein